MKQDEATRKFAKLAQTDNDNGLSLVIFMTKASARPSGRMDTFDPVNRVISMRAIIDRAPKDAKPLWVVFRLAVWSAVDRGSSVKTEHGGDEKLG